MGNGRVSRVRHQGRPRVVTALAGLSLLLPAAGVVTAVMGAPASAAPTPAPTPHDDAGTSWTVYHGNPLGTGVDTSGVTFSPANPAWTSPALDGQVYGEPLEATGRVYVATENDTDLRAGGEHGRHPVVEQRGNTGALVRTPVR